MKQIISLLAATSLFFSPLLRSDCSSEESPSCMEEVPCIEPLCIEESPCCEEDQRICTYKMVGKSSDDRLSSYKRKRFFSWVLAIGVIAIGITTLILVGHHHNKK